MATATKKKRKEEAYPWKAGASSGHTANLKQSILRLSISVACVDGTTRWNQIVTETCQGRAEATTNVWCRTYGL